MPPAPLQISVVSLCTYKSDGTRIDRHTHRHGTSHGTGIKGKVDVQSVGH